MDVDADALRSRSAFRSAFERLIGAVEPHFSPGRARVRPGSHGAIFPDVDAELEGFSRQLWAVAPLEAGGGFDGWERFRTGLRNGCDPDHDEYWGSTEHTSQKHVEMAAIGFALATAPEALWDPLEDEAKTHIAEWLNGIDDADLPDCNWLFFRVLADLGLREVGADHDWALVQDDLDRLESYYLDDGWYADGTDDGVGSRDYYVAWEMHVDGLLYAALAGDEDPERAQRFRDRASEFASEYAAWFHEDGSALPYGRSLTYRFAQAAFWGALAYADVEPPGHSWGEVRGLWARNVRWWLDQPIFVPDGTLTVGYRYQNLRMAESYNSPSSPYWAMKAALPLALPEDHPFWAAEEEPFPDLPQVTVQEQPGMVICRDDATDHHYCLATGQTHADEVSSDRVAKYQSFTYSTSFGVGVPTGSVGLSAAGHDGSLALSEDGRHWRLRERVEMGSVEDGVAYSRWHPFDDVTVDTWLIPALPWHVRVHRLDAERDLHSAEGGFPLARTSDDDPDRHEHRTEVGRALATYPGGSSGIRDPREDRDGTVVHQDPNSNLHHQRTVVPTLTAEHDPGETWLAAAVVATPDPDRELSWTDPPTVRVDGDQFVVEDPAGSTAFEWSR